MDNSKKKEIMAFSVVSMETSPIPVNIESSNSSRDFISYGEDNNFPNQLINLLNTSAIFSSCVRSYKNYVMGDGVNFSNDLMRAFPTINKDYETLEDLVQKAVNDYIIFNGFAVQVIKDTVSGRIVALYNLDFQNCRMSKDKDSILYSSKWGSFTSKTLKFPIYNENENTANSVFYFKNPETERSKTYPNPLYYSALKEIVIDGKISDYFLNAMDNNFSPSAIINFNSGQVDDDTAKKIENKLYDKFSGTKNAQKLLLSFNENADAATTIERLESSDWSNQFVQLRETITSNIYAAFRMNPLLVGVNTNTNFSTQEFSDSFRLFNRTCIMGIQKEISRAMDRLFGVTGSVSFVPFNIDFENQ